MLDFTPLDDGFALEMDTDLGNVDRCVERISTFLEERGDQEDLFAVTLLAREALNNAMIHGNGLETSRRVRFRLSAKEGGYDLGVEDQGPGFDWRSRLQASSSAEDVRGRGHEIYRNFAQTVRYNDRGNALRLEYRRERC
jgi:serine/threonine-protein kinase RsbW